MTDHHTTLKTITFNLKNCPNANQAARAEWLATYRELTGKEWEDGQE